MPRPSEWTNNNRERLREYSRKYRKEHRSYFENYEKTHWLKLKIQRKLWRKKNQVRTDYWTQEQHNNYLREWRAKKKQDKNWQSNYLETLKV